MVQDTRLIEIKDICKSFGDTEILHNIDMVGSNLDHGQGMCGSSSGSVPTSVGQPLIRVSSITVGGR